MWSCLQVYDRYQKFKNNDKYHKHGQLRSIVQLSGVTVAQFLNKKSRMYFTKEPKLRCALLTIIIDQIISTSVKAWKSFVCLHSNGGVTLHQSSEFWMKKLKQFIEHQEFTVAKYFWDWSCHYCLLFNSITLLNELRNIVNIQESIHSTKEKLQNFYLSIR